MKETLKKIFQVGEITRLIKSKLEDDFGVVWVEGEISNLRRPASGHCYFTLKDAEAQIKVALFRGSQRYVSVQLRDGIKVRAQGQLTVYEKGGEYQLIAYAVEETGRGDLLAAFEKLKAQLAAEGLFEQARKKPLPLLPHRIGIVTSPTGAALQDILNILNRRFPNLHIIIAPTRVQGAGAAQEIAAAIDLLNRQRLVEVMIVGRGGGSIEDLWCFNEEVVARAIARSAIPVISAVGHEIDFTISDFVADLRAPTPSAAAELVVAQKDVLVDRVQQGARRLRQALEGRYWQLRDRLTAIRRSYIFREPGGRVKGYRQRVSELERTLPRTLRLWLQTRQQRLDEATWRLQQILPRRLEVGRERLKRLEAQLRAFNPLGVLQRGYSLTQLEDGTVLRDAEQAKAGALLQTRLAKGVLHSRVVETGNEEI